MANVDTKHLSAEKTFKYDGREFRCFHGLLAAPIFDCFVCLQVALSQAQAERDALRDGLRKHGMHAYHECMYEFIDYGWRHRGPVTECRCGLAQLLEKPTPPVVQEEQP